MGSGGDYEFLHFIWEHLVTYSVVPNTVSKNPFSGQYGPLVPELADSWEVSATRRRGRSSSIRASSGRTARDFTSADVKFSFELCLNPKVGPCYPGGSMKSIVGAEDVRRARRPTWSASRRPIRRRSRSRRSRRTRCCRTTSWTCSSSRSRRSRRSIPRRWRRATTGGHPGKAVGTGPFIEKAYSAGQSMELARNDNYWRAKPKLDGIIRREFKDTTSALLAFEAGEVDYTYITADEVERAQRDPEEHRPAGPVGRRPGHRPQPAQEQGLRRQAGPPGVPVRDRPQVDPAERLSHPGSDPAELPVPRPDASTRRTSHNYRLRSGEGQEPS